jgi:hypothetical protein
MRKIALLPLARPTFDVPFAEENLAAMLQVIDRSGVGAIGPRTLLFDADATRAALDLVLGEQPEAILVLQVTFTDASMLAEIAARFSGRLLVWAIPEPRAGGRLRLNSFCGLNLGSHALGLRARDFDWLFASPSSSGIDDRFAALVSGDLPQQKPVPVHSQQDPAAGMTVLESTANARIAKIGEHPAGFDTCAHDAAKLARHGGICVEAIALPELFAMARGYDTSAVSALRQELDGKIDGLASVDQTQLSRSLALKMALDDIRRQGGFDAFAIRCWPETFTEYGGAVCGPVSLMGEAGIPCACEADVYGALSQLFLQKVANAPVFLTDIVDADTGDDSVVVWHCGQAPASMQAERPAAQIHSNRKMPLLMEFALKPGRVTFARISQAGGREFLAVATGEMLDRPKSFTGTSGVVRFDRSAADFANWLINGRLEHHMALAYGDYRSTLHSLAAALKIPVLDLQAYA